VSTGIRYFNYEDDSSVTLPHQTPADVESKAHVLVTDLAEAVLGDVHHHHLGRVLRLRSGDCITLTDGYGSWRSALLGTGWPSRADVEWSSDLAVVPRRAEPVAVGFALTKGDKPETVVQKLAELGVDRVVPFVAEHSVARWDVDKAVRNVARLRTIAAEALQQSRQAWLTEVAELTSLETLAQNVLGMDGGFADFGLPARADRGGVALLATTVRFVLIGPEGGWSNDERVLFPGAVGIAPAVLRAETAAIVAGALLIARTGQPKLPGRTT
jgi:16S rRNA (uracil1498-N3)-methyltransferase